MIIGEIPISPEMTSVAVRVEYEQLQRMMRLIVFFSSKK